MKYTCQPSGNSLDELGILKNPYFDASHASLASFWLIPEGGAFYAPPALMPIFISLLSRGQNRNIFIFLVIFHCTNQLQIALRTVLTYRDGTPHFGNLRSRVITKSKSKIHKNSKKPRDRQKQKQEILKTTLQLDMGKFYILMTNFLTNGCTLLVLKWLLCLKMLRTRGEGD